MKLTNGEVYGVAGPLQKLMAEKWPIRTSYGIATLASRLNTQLLIIEELRKTLVKKHGEPDEHGQYSVLPTIRHKDKDGKDIPEANPKFAQFSDEWNELLDEEVEIDIRQVTLPEMVASTCDQCHHNMDRPYEVDATTLFALSKFVTIADLPEEKPSVANTNKPTLLPVKGGKRRYNA